MKPFAAARAAASQFEFSEIWLTILRVCVNVDLWARNQIVRTKPIERKAALSTCRT
jgi:hypothetical protein